MIKNNKWKFILSALITLLPILFLIPLKNVGGMFIKGFGSFFVIMPLIMLALHIFCLLFESSQQKKQEQSKKITNIIFWIVPTLSFYVSTIMFAIAMGLEFSMSLVLAPLLGTMFIVLGNYMPKARQNRTFGIKIKWTLSSEENWNATHRFAGKLWVVLGVLILASAFLPEMIFIIVFPIMISIAVVASTLYSYIFYKKHPAEENASPSDSIYKKTDKKTALISVIAVSAILVLVTIIMFAGKLKFTLEQERLVIGASFGGGMEINYSDIESIEYRQSTVDGARVNGVASAKLLYGWFKNDEFGNYIRYTYANSDATIIIVSGGEEIVISDVDTESTKALYEALAERIK